MRERCLELTNQNSLRAFLERIIIEYLSAFIYLYIYIHTTKQKVKLNLKKEKII